MVEIKNEDGEVFRRSRNLRGILEYARLLRHDQTILRKRRNRLHVTFPDGSTCSTTFASASVLRTWIDARVKSGRFREE